MSDASPPPGSADTPSAPPPPLTEKELKGRLTSSYLILQALHAMHSAKDAWCFVQELRTGTGFHNLSEQRIDAWAIQCWNTSGVRNLRRSFEIKVSASDLKKELTNSDKRWLARAYSNEFYFVAPAGLVNTSLLEDDEGLIEWDGVKLEIVKKAKPRECMAPRWEFVASLLRSTRGPYGGPT